MKNKYKKGDVLIFKEGYCRETKKYLKVFAVGAHLALVRNPVGEEFAMNYQELERYRVTNLYIGGGIASTPKENEVLRELKESEDA